jgi:3-deoxy-7-phosphoheptulonate synthase
VRVNELGVPAAAELLDPTAARYLEDLLSWAAIGARTAESQPHRELASALALPVGLKNAVSGDLGAALDALVAARHSHSFLGIDEGGRPAVIRSPGNPDAHVVLRGGGGVPNYDPECVAWVASRARREGLARPILIDCSHGNSNKNHRLQGFVCRQVLAQVRGGHHAIAGLMLESQLREGRQSWTPGAQLEYGVSITDACIGWPETEELLREMAELMRA